MKENSLYQRTVRQARQNQPANSTCGKTWHCSKNGHNSYVAASEAMPRRCWKCDSIAFYAKAPASERALAAANTRPVFLTSDELELVVLALGLLLVPAAATLQARLAGLRP